MLTWLGHHLQFGKSAEGSLLWAAICFGYFFLLRASEYLGVGYTDPNRGLRGCDVALKEDGIPVGLDRLGYADEVVVTIRGSKTDIYNRGEVRNHFRSGDVLCPVAAAGHCSATTHKDIIVAGTLWDLCFEQMTGKWSHGKQ